MSHPRSLVAKAPLASPMTPRSMTWATAIAAATIATAMAVAPALAQGRENILVPNNGPGTLPLGTTPVSYTHLW